jgi:hypothetical protein
VSPGDERKDITFLKTKNLLLRRVGIGVPTPMSERFFFFFQNTEGVRERRVHYRTKMVILLARRRALP